jgi:uncharacterized membrane protein (UPF0127 family)
MNIARWLRLLLRQRRWSKPYVRLRIVNVSRQVELADSVNVADYGQARRKGLLGRSALSEGEGLWIVPCEAVHTFGMQFAIDLIYLDRDKRVKKIRHGVPSRRLSFCFTAHSVLELAYGSVRKSGTMPGDKLEFLCSSILDTRIDDAGQPSPSSINSSVNA